MSGDKSYLTTDGRVLYARDHCLRLHPAQEALLEFTKTQPRSQMIGDPVELQLLANLAKAIGAKKTLDIGVYTGYSALTLALALPAGSTVVACDVDDKMPAEGAKYWKQAGVEDKINVVIAPAKQTLEGLLHQGEAASFDLAFIDADKESYDDYYELSLKLVRPGGIIALDNVMMGGTVVTGVCSGGGSWNESQIKSMQALNKKIHQDERVDVTMLTLGDGTTLAFKR